MSPKMVPLVPGPAGMHACHWGQLLVLLISASMSPSVLVHRSIMAVNAIADLTPLAGS